MPRDCINRLLDYCVGDHCYSGPAVCCIRSQRLWPGGEWPHGTDMKLTNISMWSARSDYSIVLLYCCKLMTQHGSVAKCIAWQLKVLFYMCYITCAQVQPPASPTPSSPLQDSLHSQSSSQSGGHAHDDFVMVDFVSNPLTYTQNVLLHLLYGTRFEWKKSLYIIRSNWYDINIIV